MATMSLESPNRSWHPAFMPNSAAEAAPIVPRPADAPLHVETTLAAVTKEEPVANQLESQDDETAKAGWFSPDTNDDWLASDDAAPAFDPEAAMAASSVAPAPIDAGTPPSNMSKHASSVSFARTVSHEVNWDDGDDSEWNLTRTGTSIDTFNRFMPPNERTNSFPSVPPVMSPRSDAAADDLPLPSNQAADLMKGLESPSSAKSAEPAAGFEDGGFWDGEDGAVEDTFLGGDLSGTAEDASDARFEEGLPLIPHQPEEESIPESSHAYAEGKDLFADESSSHDDGFFSQAQGSEPDWLAAPGSSPTSLQRKSTMQLMGELNSSLSRDDSNLEGWPEDLETPEAGEPLGVMNKNPPAENKTDLAAKWAEAFDDDDGLLLDDTEPAENKELDATAFFGSDDEGFLDDDEPEPAQPQTAPVPSAPSRSTSQSKYMPQAPEPTQQPARSPYAPAPFPPAAGTPPVNPYQPSAQAAVPTQSPYSAQYNAQQFRPPQPAVTPLAAQQQQRPEPAKAQSFADKSKGGYSSPYDLPMEVVKPRKRPSMNFQRNTPTSVPQESPRGPPQMPPPRTSSISSQGPPLRAGSTSSLSPPTSSHSNHGPPAMSQKPSMPILRNKESFFEELPMTSRPRPSSRQSNRVPSPSQQSPVEPRGPPMGSLQGPPTSHSIGQAPPEPHAMFMTRSSSGGVPNLVAPERVSPYAPLQTHPAHVPAPTLPPPAAPSSRYSPAPPQSSAGANGVLPPSNRYSPAPGATKPPVPHYGVPAAVLQHQPRTTSPLVNELTHDRAQASSAPVPVNGDHSYLDRRASANHEPRVTRVSSLPPMSEEGEEDDFKPAARAIPPLQANVVPPTPAQAVPPMQSYAGLPAQSPMVPPTQTFTAPPPVPAAAPMQTYTTPLQAQPAPPPQTFAAPPPTVSHESRYGPVPPLSHRQTPPPASTPPSHTLMSPPKRATNNYTPPYTQGPAKEQEFAPPQRSHTQSPGALYGRYAPGATESVPRPSSVHSPTSPRSTRTSHSAHAPATRHRGPSLTFNWVEPTDGRQHDPLKRWKGAPVISWGVGGTLVTSFPKNVPRYGVNDSTPMIVRSPGEIRVKNVKDIQPLEDRLAKFPGPLKGKSKKKETIAWLTAGIETLERELPQMSYGLATSHEDKRAVERILLWQILRVFIEFDGTLEGSPAVEKAVRDVLSPNIGDASAAPPGFSAANIAGTLQESASTRMQTDGVDSSTIDEIRRSLLLGDREKAVWAAVDKRLWAHAMVISSTISPDLYKKVAQEFVRKEVNYPGHSNESLAFLYNVLSGNFEECVDELVPSHARAGLQLMSTSSASGVSKDAMDGLDKWRETLSLVLSNRRPDDELALNELGKLLSGYGRAEAAHICFLFARRVTVFGGLDDPNSNFVLVGADHRRQADHFAKETEALLLSEVYEYGLSLSGGSNLGAGVPHLAAYKLQHAMTLAEYGFRDKALQYAEAIAYSITSQTRRSQYHHALLESEVEDLITRLRQAPKEQSSSWIPKPSMAKVSDSMWNRFNKFVAGDENEGSGAASPIDGGVENGPFARIAGGTPTISRSPSVSHFEMHGPAAGFSTAGPPAGQPATRAASRYAPAPMIAPTGAPANTYEPTSAYAPAGRSSMERTSSELSRSPYEPTRPVPAPAPQPQPTYGGYMPQQSTAPPAPAQGFQPPSYGYSPESSFGQDDRLMSQPSFQQPVVPPTSAPAPLELYGKPEASPMGNGTPPMPNFGSGIGENQAQQGYQPPSYGYEPASQPSSEEPPTQVSDDSATGGYDAPSFQPYGYQAPSYEPYQPDPEPENEDLEEAPKPKKRGPMYDDDEDDMPALKPQEKTKSEKDRENEEMFRKAAEEDAKRAEAAKAAKKGWGFGWWGGAGAPKKETAEIPNRPTKANLGEASSFVYDPELKRWVNKKAGAETTEAKKATPPPPKSVPRSVSGTPPPPGDAGRASAPPAGPPRGLSPGPPLGGIPRAASQDGLAPPVMARSASNTSASGGPPSGPPSRPATSMGNASSIDDLIGAAGPRKPGAKKAKKGGRYVDVMAK